MSYVEEQDKLKIQKGERVLISRKAFSNEEGWNNTWINDMNQYVDTIGMVEEISGQSGIYIKHLDGKGWCYPYFILTFVDR